MVGIEWKAPESKKHNHGNSGGIKTGYLGSLEIWLGSIDGVFGEDGRSWVGVETMQSNWEILVKDN